MVLTVKSNYSSVQVLIQFSFLCCSSMVADFLVISFKALRNSSPDFLSKVLFAKWILFQPFSVQSSYLIIFRAFLRHLNHLTYE